jgi:hypothetical protein
MADSSTNLETIAASQASKETTANALFDAGSASTFGGRHAEASSGLSFGLYGGRWGGSTVSNAVLTLGASTTSYIVANRTTGAITASTATTNWTDTGNYARLYKVVTGSSTVSSYEDHRVGPGGLYASGGAGGTLTDGDKGDITVSSSGTAWAIDNDVVTYAKMQNVSATSRVLGRKTAGAGDPEELTLSDLLDFIGSAAQGDILYRGAAGWARLAAGTSGQVLQTQGAAANPQWTSPPFDLTAFYPGVPTASALVTRVPLARAVVFPASLTNSVFKARVAATAQTDFDVQKNGSSFGTIRFAAAGTTATFIAASQTTFAAGDVLSIIAPTSPDATLADIGGVLVGTR